MQCCLQLLRSLAHSAPEVLMCLASSLREPIEKRKKTKNFRQNTLTHFTTQNKQLGQLVQIQQSSCQGESASVISPLFNLNLNWSRKNRQTDTKKFAIKSNCVSALHVLQRYNCHSGEILPLILSFLRSTTLSKACKLAHRTSRGIANCLESS